MKFPFVFCIIILISLQTVPQAFANHAVFNRIIAIGSPVVEILCALGLEKQLIARSGWDIDDNLFPALEKLPDIGNPFNPNLEQIIYLKPDMVVLGSEMGILAKELEKYDIACVMVQAYNTREIIPAIHELASIFHCEKRAVELVKELSRIERILQNHRRIMQEKNVSRKKGIHFTQINSLYAVSSLSGSTLLEDAGTCNFADRTDNAYPQLSREWLLHYPVDFMVFPVRKKLNGRDREQFMDLYEKKILQGSTCIFMDEKLTFGIRSSLGSLFLAMELYPQHFETLHYPAVEHDFLQKIFPTAFLQNEESL